MDRNTLVMGAVDWRQRGTPVDGGEPAGIAVRKNIDPGARTLALPGLRDQVYPVVADSAVCRDISLGDLTAPRQSYGKPMVFRHIDQRPPHLCERPTQIDCGRARLGEHRYRRIKPGMGGICGAPESDAVSGGGTDQRRSANLHRTDRMSRILDCLQPKDDQL